MVLAAPCHNGSHGNKKRPLKLAASVRVRRRAPEGNRVRLDLLCRFGAAGNPWFPGSGGGWFTGDGSAEDFVLGLRQRVAALLERKGVWSGAAQNSNV